MMFKPGERVFLARASRANFRGKYGTVKRFLKSRNLVRVLVGRVTYDAKPESLDRVVGLPACGATHCPGCVNCGRGQSNR